MVSHGGGLVLDAERVGRVLAAPDPAGRVERDAASAEALGLSSTPAFFVNGVHYTDAYDAGSLVAALRGEG
jgi:protein-disulfide isomerase